MRAQWEGVRESLVQSIVTLESDLLFRELRRVRTVLSTFESPSELVHFLSSVGGSLDEKDAIHAALIGQVQDRGRDADLAFSIAMLGLWPGLDWVYRRNLRFFPSAPDELVSEISDLFTSNIANADLSRINRVAATLVLNVNRDLRRRLRRSWDEGRQQAALPDDDALDTDDIVKGPWAVDASEDASLRDFRGWVNAVVAADRELLERVLLQGENTKEAGEALGLSHAAARKRYGRALEKVRRAMSHSSHRNGASSTGPRGPRRRECR